MEEPKKVLRAQYLGSMQVTQATGMEVLNEAIEHIVANTPINQWRNVNVAVAPSMISILTPNVSKLRSSIVWRIFRLLILFNSTQSVYGLAYISNIEKQKLAEGRLIIRNCRNCLQEDKLITECRVRYLSFLGIGRNVKQCAFIMHTAQDLFIAHVFNCEPSSGALCKTIEAACKV